MTRVVDVETISFGLPPAPDVQLPSQGDRSAVHRGSMTDA